MAFHVLSRCVERTRFTLLDAYGCKKIERLAQRLGAFFSVPVWNHVGAVARDFW